MPSEQRCTDLGSSCICSEPFQMTGFDSGPDFWNPNDTSTKECGVEAADDDGAIVRTASDVTVRSDSTALDELPTGHSVARYASAGSGHTGTFYVGHGIAVSSSFVRVAARVYVWKTSTYQHKGDGSCNNSKFFQGDGWNTDLDVGSNLHMLNTSGEWTPDVDCCSSGPGDGLDFDSLKGKWWRFEPTMIDRDGPNFRLIIYAKNITDDEAEFECIDTNDAPICSGSNCRPQDPDVLQSTMTVNGHRDGTCSGHMGVIYYMYAGWTTDSGQRIGAASEVEGGGSSPGGGGGGEEPGGIRFRPYWRSSNGNVSMRSGLHP